MTNNIVLSNIKNVILCVITLLLSIMIGYEVIYFLLYFFISDLLFLIFNGYRSLKERNIYFVSFSFLFILSCVLIYHHTYFYEMPFDAYGDDKRFYEWGVSLKENPFVSTYSIYEKFIAVIFIFYEFFGVGNSVYQVLPINIVFGAFTIVLSHRIALNVVGRDVSYFILFLTILLNYSYSQNVVHLYRDVYVAFFSVIFLLDVLEKKRRALLWVILIMPFRFPNGLILLFLYVFSYLLYLDKNKLLKFLTLSGFSLVIILAMIFTNASISKYQLGSVDKIVTDRVAKFSGEASEVGGGMAKVNSMPAPIRFIINNYAQVIRPISINGLYHPVRESLKNEKILNHRSIGWGITTMSLIFLIGPYFLGVTNIILMRNNLNKDFCLYFIIMCITIGFFSFLDRHRVLIIPLLPTVYAIGCSFSSGFSIGIRRNQLFIILSVLFGGIVIYGVI
ncbi:TPA: hypothetical protein ACGUPD_004232 [Vibrio vulnificus]|nr:hypothetical protein [Vibrio vulnificus]HDY7562773.1 hypothetical protein [Vibrio vulnificus]